jgi:hypothetical protein
MPINNSYLLLINSNLIPDKHIIIATNSQIQQINLNLPKTISASIGATKGFHQLRLFTKHATPVASSLAGLQPVDKLLKPNRVLQTPSILTDVECVGINLLSMTHIYDDNAQILHNLITSLNNSSVSNLALLTRDNARFDFLKNSLSILLSKICIAVSAHILFIFSLAN